MKDGGVWREMEHSKKASLPWLCVRAKSFPSSVTTLWPHGLQPTRLLCPWGSLDKKTGVGCHVLLQALPWLAWWTVLDTGNFDLLLLNSDTVHVRPVLCQWVSNIQLWSQTRFVPAVTQTQTWYVCALCCLLCGREYNLSLFTGMILIFHPLPS